MASADKSKIKRPRRLVRSRAVVTRSSKKPHQKQQSAAGDSAAQDTSIDTLAKLTWVGKKNPEFDSKLVTSLLQQMSEKRQVASALERSQYLEKYLLPNLSHNADSQRAHVLSIMAMVNEKRQERLATAWRAVTENKEQFDEMFGQMLALAHSVFSGEGIEGVDGMAVRQIIVQFLIECFGSLENAAVRPRILSTVSVSTWHNIEARVLCEREFERVPRLRKFAKHSAKQLAKAGAEERRQLEVERDLIPMLIRDYAVALYGNAGGAREYCAKVLELLVDIESQLPSRRYAHLLIVDQQVVDLTCSSAAYREHRGELAQAADMLAEYVDFQVGNVTGQALADGDAKSAHYADLVALQAVAFREFPTQLEPLVVASTRTLGEPETLTRLLGVLSDSDVVRLAAMVGVRTKCIAAGHAELAAIMGDGGRYSRAFVIGAIARRYAAKPTVGDRVRSVSLYPTETQLYSAEQATGRGYYPVCVQPKLNLQFLTVGDYLARSFALFRLESAHEIRSDIDDAVRRLAPRPRSDFGGDVEFAGWARMAMPLEALEVVDVQKPRVGEQQPARVAADLRINLAAYTQSVRTEWQTELRPRDVLVLVEVDSAGGVRRVRGCEIECLVDPETGRAVDEAAGDVLSVRVALDAFQYHGDSDDVYAGLNLVVRRRPQESSFKAVLQTIRDLMLGPGDVVPQWLSAALLGYGDPSEAASLSKMPRAVDFRDTFVSLDHLRACFAQYTVETRGCVPDAASLVVEFPDPATDSKLVTVRAKPEELRVTKGHLAAPLRNTVPFTRAQVDAIRAGTAGTGLTLVVGPPGTGKTDVAVQIIANLYHAHPQQRTLLITHSNQALNQLFEKIARLDIDARHLLRLGHGSDALDTDEEFSRSGRVDSYLARRLELLSEVDGIARALSIAGDFGASCETARQFYVSHVRTRWEAYARTTLQSGSAGDVVAGFPFAGCFGGELFGGSEAPRDLARAAYASLERTFDELEQVRPFELLRSAADRANYLLASSARIVAMTSTHCALKHREFEELGVAFDSVVVEEAAQMLEVSAFIPLTLKSKLKRVVMLGDHNQLPPVVKDRALADRCGLEQSMFARLVRLGVPHIMLDRQGRARPEIAALYSWRYVDGGGGVMGDLEAVRRGEFAAKTNPGFARVYQFVDVADFGGVGETEPSAHYYQNVAEGEYVVAVFQYMVLSGAYDPGSITILTTYNGQKDLIRDIYERRCGAFADIFYKRPIISTVDQYQGQQNSYVLLSLVRTKRVGHLRDMRRLVVAMSRARLGLYVFGRWELFVGSLELEKTMRRLADGETRLELCRGGKVERVEGVEAMGEIVFGMMRQLFDEVVAD